MHKRENRMKNTWLKEFKKEEERQYKIGGLIENNCKMVAINSNISEIELHENWLNTLIRR